MEPVRESVADKETLNWRHDMIVKGGTGIGVAWCLAGVGFSSYWIARCSFAIALKQKENCLQKYFNLKDHEHCQTVSFKKRWETHFYPNLRDYRYETEFFNHHLLYYNIGGPGKIMNIPVVHCSGIQQPFRKNDRYFM